MAFTLNFRYGNRAFCLHSLSENGSDGGAKKALAFLQKIINNVSKYATSMDEHFMEAALESACGKLEKINVTEDFWHAITEEERDIMLDGHWDGSFETFENISSAMLHSLDYLFDEDRGEILNFFPPVAVANFNEHKIILGRMYKQIRYPHSYRMIGEPRIKFYDHYRNAGYELGDSIEIPFNCLESLMEAGSIPILVPDKKRVFVDMTQHWEPSGSFYFGFFLCYNKYSK